MWKHIAANGFTVLIFALVVGFGVITWGQKQYSDPGPLTEAYCLQVAPGSNMARVSDTLEESGAISNKTIYRLGADYSEKSADLKAGSFLVEPGASMAEIVDLVTGDGVSTCGTRVQYLIAVNNLEIRVNELDPETQQFARVAEFDPAAEEVPAAYEAAVTDVATQFDVTVVEGVTSWQVVNGLNASTLFAGEVAEVPAEGTLAPGGYEIRPGQDRAAFLADMAAEQEARLAVAWEARAEDAPVSTPEEALILASIIEKETAVPEERRQVASVFANRLEQGMRLQTDPTVIYGVTEGRGVLGRGLRQSELRAATPWNTYVIEGLPPTPIANPGLASIEAALDPDETDYIFFVADGTGGHAFAVTLAEHNENVARWREIEAERAQDN
ncbi:MAG: endolytic transglycosylase MltG [Pseudomonadota bacterium]